MIVHPDTIFARRIFTTTSPRSVPAAQASVDPLSIEPFLLEVAESKVDIRHLLKDARLCVILVGAKDLGISS
jgi:hypothetical protein